MDLLRFAEIESHTILSIKLIMDLLRFAEIEPHAIISIKLIMDLLRFVKTNLGFESYFSGFNFTVYN
jgi:hypothetical protein